MAASFQIHPFPHRHPLPAGRPARPRLTVIEGGRSGVARRRRRVFLLRRVFVATVAVALGLGAVAAVSAIGAPASPVVVPATYEVSAGETLWSIAGELGLDVDRRAVVEVLAEANGGPVVRPGQHLVIPAELATLVG
jgi:hypothetical protein